MDSEEYIPAYGCGEENKTRKLATFKIEGNFNLHNLTEEEVEIIESNFLLVGPLVEGQDISECFDANDCEVYNYSLSFDICDDNDSDKICDNVDDCIGNNFDCEGVCNGDAIIDCLGVCSGNVPDLDGDGIADECDDCIDLDADGICDADDDCVGVYDQCDICNGDGIDTDGDGTCDSIDDCPYDAIDDLDDDGLCGCTLKEDNSTYIDQSLCYGNDIDLDNDNDGIPNYADACPNDDGIVGHDWDYGNSDDTGACSGACDRESCEQIEGARWNEYTKECGDGICDSIDPCVGVVNDSSECVSADDVTLANQLILYQNAPNPFNPSTKINFELDVSDYIELSIYDLNGRLVNTLASGFYNKGLHDLVWNAKNYDGVKVGSGIYIYQLKTSKRLITKKMVFIK